MGDDNKIISSEELLQSVQNAKSEGVLFQLLGAEIFNVQAKSGDISYEKCAASDIFVVADYLKRNGNSEMEEPVKIIKEYLTEILKKSFDFDSPLAKSIPGRVKEKAGKYAPEFLVPLEKIEKEKLAEMNKAAEEVKNKVEPEEEKVAEGKAEVIQNYKRGSFARREAMLRQKKDDLAKRKAAMAKRKTELETAATWPNIKVTRLPISSIDPNSPHLYECLWQTKFCPAFLVENTDSNQEFQEASVAEMAKICGKDRKNATVSQKEAAKVVLEYMRENIKIAVDKSSTVAEHLSYVAGLFDHSPNSQME
ncbi:MAG: hypothetical protein LBI56_02570 [Puniceicoccales bacterium]|nr:hypothetical protein [Puniceicoccales bacterium]